MCNVCIVCTLCTLCIACSVCTVLCVLCVLCVHCVLQDPRYSERTQLDSLLDMRSQRARGLETQVGAAGEKNGSDGVYNYCYKKLD